MVPNGTRMIIVAATSMLAGIDSEAALFVTRPSWENALAAASKPSLFITLMRKFPYVVDSGLLAVDNVLAARAALEVVTPDDLEAEAIAKALHTWIIEAWKYCELAPPPPEQVQPPSPPIPRRVVASGFVPGLQLKEPVQLPATPASLSPAATGSRGYSSLQAPASAPAVTQAHPRMERIPQQKPVTNGPTPVRSSARLPGAARSPVRSPQTGPRSVGGAVPARRSSPPPGATSTVRRAAASRFDQIDSNRDGVIDRAEFAAAQQAPPGGSALPSQAPTRQPPSRAQPRVTEPRVRVPVVGTPSVRGLPPSRPSTGVANSNMVNPQGHATRIRPGVKAGGYPSRGLEPSTVGLQPKLNVQDARARLQQVEKETREMKAMEASLRWNMKRDEERLRKSMRQDDQKEVQKWRQEQTAAAKEYKEQKQDHAHKADLQESRDHQETKRDNKAVEKEQDLERQRDQYLEQKENSEWIVAEQKARIPAERHMLIEDKLESMKTVAEHALEEQQREKCEELDAIRVHEQTELNHQVLKARVERDAALEALEHVRQQQLLKADATAHFATRPVNNADGNFQ